VTCLTGVSATTRAGLFQPVLRRVPYTVVVGSCMYPTLCEVAGPLLPFAVRVVCILRTLQRSHYCTIFYFIGFLGFLRRLASAASLISTNVPIRCSSTGRANISKRTTGLRWPSRIAAPCPSSLLLIAAANVESSLGLLGRHGPLLITSTHTVLYLLPSCRCSRPPTLASQHP
jgi:hypothetical protein